VGRVISGDGTPKGPPTAGCVPFTVGVHEGCRPFLVLSVDPHSDLDISCDMSLVAAFDTDDVDKLLRDVRNFLLDLVRPQG